MESAKKVSQNYLIARVYNSRTAKASPDAVYQKLLKKAAENPESLNNDEWKFMAKELPHLRTAYGVYLSICEGKKIEKLFHGGHSICNVEGCVLLNLILSRLLESI